MSALGSVEELRQQLKAEQDAHAATMAQLREKTCTFQAVLAEQQEAFTDLVTRVTELRVAKGECMAAQVAGRAPHMSFNTGSDFLDSLLYSLDGKRKGLEVSVVASVLQKLETAALEALTPYAPGRVSALFTSNSSAVRTTGLLVLFPNDVRGVRQWVRKHVNSCASCAARQTQLPAWAPHRYDREGTGFAAAPNLRAIPNKKYHHVSISFLQERSLADRMDRERQLVILRTTALMHVQSAQSAQPLADAEATCAQMTTALKGFLAETMSEISSTTSTSAPWNTGANPNSDLSAAIEVLLHVVEPRVQVRPVQQVAVDSTGASCTLVEMEATVSVPLHISPLAPLLRLMGDPAQRAYVIQQVLTPLARRIGDALGYGGLAAHYTAIGLQFVEALYRIAVHQGIVDADRTSSGRSDTAYASSQSSAPGKDVKSKILGQLYLIFQALAVFGTSVDVEVTTPHISASQLEPKQNAKKAALRLTRTLLRKLSAPSPLMVPQGDDADSINMTLKVSRAPTTFLEVLNCAFSSNHRLPPTSRSTTLDTFMSPKAKISLGLKLFKELVVEVHRPYHPCTGLILATENGVGGRPRAPPCVPVIDLPVDVVDANVRFAAYVQQLLQKLDQLETSDAVSEEGRLEREGKAFVQHLASTLQQAAPAERLCRHWASAQVRVKEVQKVCADILIPFEMKETDARAATKPLLYLHVVYGGEA
ncbi:hypothetical protein, conserved [Leishmania tarentolae]|uniref:Uncharacterized protein n=1 Tax=Leishmania tarentolae TaxID=5689 RepID=A0A640KJ09_LEITA|nr:hypothetical protein, conserved [Leishmania tarentolae]